MNVTKELNEISERVFNESYSQILSNWMAEQRQDPYFGEIAADYEKAIEFLAQRLNTPQSGELAGLERLFKERQDYAARYCFSCGLYGTFEQFFDGEDADNHAFRRLVEDGLMTMPGMERHVSFYENGSKCLAIIKHLNKALDREGEEHLISVESAWEERIHSTALISYYCGYRAGLAILERISPMKSLQMTKHLLMTEYELGLTNTYQQRERNISA